MFSIIVGAIVMFAVGAVWFTVLFGRIWTHLMNFTPEARTKAMTGGMAGKMVVMFILNIVSATVLHYLLPLVLSLSMGEFICTVVIIWLGFTLPSLVNTYLWEGKSVRLVLLNAGGSIVAFLAGAATIYFMM